MKCRRKNFVTPTHCLKNQDKNISTLTILSVSVGYLILNEKGFILAANFARAFMLGIEPHSLTNKPLSKYIVKEDTDALYKGV
ncbi:MAG: hypothetical protein H3C64_12795 [Candidatus Kuenenia stuttgartiensis]|nr:hypothetical protein [Candidatus Kuenenia stuttgartiensis]